MSKKNTRKKKRNRFFGGINLTVIVLEDPHEVTEVPDEPAHDLEWAKHVVHCCKNDGTLKHCEDYYEALKILQNSGEPHYFMEWRLTNLVSLFSKSFTPIFLKIYIALSLNKDIIPPAKNLALSFISYCNANEIINAKTSGYLCSITHYWRNLMIPFGKSPVP